MAQHPLQLKQGLPLSLPLDDNTKPYTAKHLRGEIFAVSVENEHSQENFHGSSFFQY